MDKPIIHLERGVHRDQKVIFLRFSYDQEVFALIKPFGAKFSKTKKCWYIPRAKFNFEDFRSQLSDDLSVNYVPKKIPEIKNPDPTTEIVNLETNVEEGIVYIRFLYDAKIIREIKRMRGSWYHPGAKIWSVPNTEGHVEETCLIFKSAGYQIKQSITSDLHERIQTFKKKPKYSLVPGEYLQQLKLENKSQRTIEIYSSFLNHFFNHFNPIPADHIPMLDIRKYILFQRDVLGYSESYQNQLISSLKSFYRVMYKKELTYEEIPRPKKSRTLPRVIAKEQVEKMINKPTNLKHRLILAMLYGCGLRLNELISLEKKHLNWDNNTLLVVSGKGRKDRRIPLPLALLPLLKQYLKSYLPVSYLFNGTEQIQYSSTSVQRIVKDAAKNAGILVKVTPHTLRHCYATHMLEKGVDLRYIQELLGHQSSKTTEIYTHVSNRQLSELGNPLDDIKF